VPKKGKIYPLSRVEREEVQEFVKDQLRKGYIRPLKSLQMSLVIRRVCGQTLGLGLVDRNRTVVIISLQRMEST